MNRVPPRGELHFIRRNARCAGTGESNLLQTTKSRQSHSGAAGTGAPSVQYAYANGAANIIRPSTLTYPSGRVLTYNYASGIDDAAGRISALIDDDSTSLAAFSYLGSGAVVQVDHAQPSLRYTLIGSGAGGWKIVP